MWTTKRKHLGLLYVCFCIMLLYTFISESTNNQLKYSTYITKKNEKLDIINNFYWTFCFLYILTPMMTLIFLWIVQLRKDRYFTTLCVPYVFVIYNIGKTIIFFPSNTAVTFPLREQYWCWNWAMHVLYLSSLNKIAKSCFILKVVVRKKISKDGN